MESPIMIVVDVFMEATEDMVEDRGGPIGPCGPICPIDCGDRMSLNAPPYV